MSLVARGSVDIRPLNKNCSWRPFRHRLLREESPDAVAVGIRAADTSEMTRGIGAADTSEMIRAKISAMRPARERIFEYCIITDQP